MNLIEKSLEVLNSNIYLRKKYIEELFGLADTKNVVVVEWQRRVGKSYIILGFLNYYNIDKNKVFYLNKEIDENEEIKNNIDLSNLFDNFVKENWEAEYIIIDEIQDIEKWELFIRSKFALKKYKIIVSGSNSHLLGSELVTYLTWRTLKLFVYPFSYYEYLDFFKSKDSKEKFLEYIKYWWLPEILFIKEESIKQNYIKNTIETLILKDIVKRFKIKDIDLIEKILKYLSNILWSIISVRNIQGYLQKDWTKIISTNTLSNYVRYLEFPFLIHKVNRFKLNWKKILEYKDKYYFNDIGIRNSFWLDIQFDIGKILENLVYIKLKRDWYEVYVWELYDKEIDFVAKKWDNIIYVQVAYLIPNNEVRDREFGNLQSIKDNFEKIVVSMDDIASWKNEGIKWINVRDFLLK